MAARHEGLWLHQCETTLTGLKHLVEDESTRKILRATRSTFDSSDEVKAAIKKPGRWRLIQPQRLVHIHNFQIEV